MEKYWWEGLSDNKLLDLRFRDLKLKIKGSRVEPLIFKIYDELKSHKIKFKPHFYISDDWYAIMGVPGVAVPFFTLHKRLARLQRKKVFSVEGWTERECLKLIRHEAGHAIDNAFHLRRSKKRQKLFGLSSLPYPDSYLPKAYSKKFVVHLNSFYAQSHPDEDWAETFAVWLNPDSNWKKRYERWPAIKKLLLVDQMMVNLSGKKPLVTRKDKIGDISKSDKTLRQYYQEKIDHLGLNKPFYLDPILPKLFSKRENERKTKRAAQFIRENRKLICKKVSKWTGQYQYTISLILDEIIESCSQRNLYLIYSEQETSMDLVGMLTTQTLNFIDNGHHKISM